VLAIVGLSVGYLTVRWLTPEPLPSAETATPDLEAAWNETISRLGIDPVYPPEEDLMVGDLLARVIADEPDPSVAKKSKLDSQSPFLRRTVKIAHIDLRDQLDLVYAMITVFPAAASPQRAQDSEQSVPSKIHPTSSREFAHEVALSELPHAAFPSLKIQGLNNASVGVSAGRRGSATFGADNRGIELI
jgi:hypothetical protein